MNANDIHIIKMRQGGRPKIVTIDEAMHMYDGINKNIIIFDQDNEIAHAIHPANSPYVQKTGDLKYEIESFKYERIVTIKSYMNEEDLNQLLDKLISDSVITEEDKASILETVLLKN